MMGASAYRSRVTPTVALPARPEPNKRIEHPCARTPSCRPTRSLRSLGPEGLFSETTAKAAPLGARLAPHLQSSDARHEFARTTTALPLPRKVDPAHHPQRARGQAPARVRAGQECSRPAL